MANKNFSKANKHIMGRAVEQQKNIDEIIKEKMIILPELEALIPALTDEEYAQLQSNIDAEGCRDALIVWERDENDYVLVDGHNRYHICKALKKDFKVVLQEFESLESVKDWMINNQLGKRNVTEQVKSYLRGLQYNREKKAVGGHGINQHLKSDVDNLSTKRTTEKLAEEHKVSAKTIERDEKFALGLDALVGEDSTLKSKILNKEILISKGLIESIAKKTPEEIAQIRQDIYTGELQKQPKTALPTDQYKEKWKKLGVAIQVKDKEAAQVLLKELTDAVEKW